MTSIAEERRRLADVGFVHDDLREDWGATGSYTDPRAVVVPALGFVQHIAVIADPSDLLGTERQVMRNIERIGWARFPNTGYSYNAAAFNSGRTMEGQPFGRRGAHTYNDENRATCNTAGCPSIGTPLKFNGAGADRRNLNYTHRACVFPQQTSDPVTDAQVDGSARWAAAHILAGLAVPGARWHGHRCVSAKDCPGNRAWARMDDINDLTATYARTGLPGAGDWLDMATKDDVKAAVREVLAEQAITLDWDGGPPAARKWSVYEVLGKLIHFNAADGSFEGDVPATSLRTGQAGKPSAYKRLVAKLDEVLGKLPPGEGDPAEPPPLP